ncbi:hypothetical protein MY3296_008178 [Beauveria thailandica]
MFTATAKAFLSDAALQGRIGSAIDAKTYDWLTSRSFAAVFPPTAGSVLVQHVM